MAFYTENELKQIGFKSIGKNVKISNKSSIYNPSAITIGNNVRIDDFVIITADKNITIGNNVHIGAYSALYGRFGIELEDFVSISVRCTLFSASDDFSGEAMTNPTIPEKYLNLNIGKIILEKHSIIGAHSIIMPGVIFKEGAALGLNSVAYKDLKEWTIYVGNPCRIVNARSNKILDLENQYKEDISNAK